MITVITGVGAKGQVGEAVAGALARRGDTVVVVSRSAEEVEARATELRASGGKAFGYACDLADPADVEKLAQRVAREHGGRIDALVNLAGGFGSSGPLAGSDPAQVSRMWSINFTTAYLTTRAFLPMMTGGGSVVFFASEVVLEGSRSKGVAGYAAAKAAVVALMRSVADEGRSTGIRANALAPGSIRTASNVADMGGEIRYVEREEVADAVAFLCSSSSEAVSGQVIRLSGVKGR